MTQPAPSPLYSQTFRSLLDRALSEDLGLFVECVNPKSFEAQVSRIKQVYPQYDSLMLCWPSLPNTIYIVKKSVELTA